MNRIVAVSICICALVGCGGDGAPTTAPPPAPTPAPPPAPPPPPETPSVPTGLRVSASGEDFIEWTWNMVEGADGYDVQFSANEAFTSEDEIIARTGEELSYRREGLAAGTSAYLRVRSASGSGDDRITSDWSTHVAGMTAAPEPQIPPPLVPTELRVSGRGEDFIEWSWDPVDGVSGYDVQFSTNETFSDEDEIIARTGEELSYRREGLAAGTSASLRVRSASGSGDDRITSDWSTHVAGMTAAPEPQIPPPPVPTELRVSDRGEDFIEWSWDPVDGVSGYDVQFSTNETFSDEDEIIARTVEQVSYRRDGFEEETDAYLRVRSASGTGEDRVTSDWSTHVSGMTLAAAPPPPEAPGTPTGLRVSAETADSITWTWNAVAGAQGYLVQISTDEMFEDMFEGDDRYAVSIGTSYTAADLEPDTTLYIRVAAGVLTAATPSLNPEDYLLSAWTTPATGMTAAPPPPPPHVADFVRGRNLAGRRGHRARSLLHEPGSGVLLGATIGAWRNVR